MKKVPLFYEDKLNLTFDDVCLVDGLSSVDSRSSVDLTSNLTKGYTLSLPVMTAAMDTITSSRMAKEMVSHGGAIIHHRNQSIEQRADLLAELQDHPNVVEKKAINGVAVGLRTTAEQAKDLIDNGANLICIEVAHAYIEAIADKVQEIGPVCRRENVLLMVGNFSSVDAAKWLAHETGNLVDIVKVSQGGGSCCTTRLVTGIGKPTWQATADMANADLPFLVVADGGLKTSGDIAKAIGAGACAGMIGGMLSGTNEAPGKTVMRNGKVFKEFRGMASSSAKYALDGSKQPKNVEGISTVVPAKGPVGNIFNQIRDGLQSSIASCGFSSLTQFQQEVQFIRVSGASRVEASPHAKDIS